jgi:hypothetical protein
MCSLCQRVSERVVWILLGRSGFATRLAMCFLGYGHLVGVPSTMVLGSVGVPRVA